MEEKRKEVEQGANGARPVGRPFGGRPKVRPQSAARQETTRRNGRPMLKCTPEAVQLAENWVEEVPLTGPTNMRSGLEDVSNYLMADCVYLVSDGRADSPIAVLEFLADQVEYHNWNIPVHAIGVECTASGRRVLEAIAEMTDGSFTPYEWDGHAKGPPPKEDWTDLEIRRLRMENMANGVVDEPLPVTKAKVRKVFYKDFLVEIETENQARLFRAKEKYEEELLEWETNNAVEYDMAKQDWEDACDAVAAEKSRREEEAATRWRAACRETAEYNQALDEIVEEKGDEIEEWARAWQLLMDAYNEECERLRMAHEAAEQPVVDELNRMKVKSSFSVYESQLEAIRARNAEVKEQYRVFRESMHSYQEQVAQAYALDVYRYAASEARARMRFEAEMHDAEQFHKLQCAEVEAENERSRERYDREVEAWRDYLAEYEDWLVKVRSMTQRREEAEARVKDTYGAAVTRAREAWERKKQAVETANKRERELSKVRYDAEVKAIRKQNADQLAAWQEVIRALQRQISTAKARHHWECLRIWWGNLRRRQGARFAWHSENLIAQGAMERQHRQKIYMWELQVEDIRQDNLRKEEAAKAAYGRALLAVKKANDNALLAAKEAHRVAMKEVRAWNEDAAPRIERCIQIKQELDYCEAFLKQIRTFAGERPERVVEMSSIHKSLAQAVPGGIPWPKLSEIHVMGRERHERSRSPASPGKRDASPSRCTPGSFAQEPSDAHHKKNRGSKSRPVSAADQRPKSARSQPGSRPGSGRSRYGEEHLYSSPYNGREPLCWYDQLRLVSDTLKTEIDCASRTPTPYSSQSVVRPQPLLQRRAGTPARHQQPNFVHRQIGIGGFAGSMYFQKADV